MYPKQRVISINLQGAALDETASETLTKAIDRVLGEGAVKKLSAEAIAEKLGLDINPRTLRNALSGISKTRKSTIDEILKSVDRFVPLGSEIEHYPFHVAKCREEVEELLTNQGGAIAKRGDLLPCDVIYDANGFGINQTLVRCLQDVHEVVSANGDYFNPLIDLVLEEMTKRDCLDGIIVTHRLPSRSVVNHARSVNVAVVQFGEFITKRMGLDRVFRFLSERITERNISSDVFERLPGRIFDVDGEFENVDSWKALKEFLDGEIEGSKSAAIVGSFGSGKSSLALVIAHEFAKRFKQNSPNWVIPLWIRASSFESQSVDDAIHSAFRMQVEHTGITLRSIKSLINDGRVWLFVDGLDEAPSLRFESNLRKRLRTLYEVCGQHGRIVISIRSEVLDSRRAECSAFLELAKESSIEDSILLQLESMPEDVRDRVILARTPERVGQLLLSKIHWDQRLNDLTCRPIFLDIVAASAQFLPTLASASVFQLFENYTRKWASGEVDRSVPLTLPEDERLEVCEVLALAQARFGVGDKEGFSASDLETIARELDKKKYRTTNFRAFVNEAQVAMFLQRGDNDRFSFAHSALCEFFLARTLSRDIEQQPPQSQRLAAMPLDRTMPLFRLFLYEYFDERGMGLYERLRDILDKSIGWREVTDVSQLEGSVDYLPPFGVGMNYYLLPNLIGLCSEDPGQNLIDLRGGHLPMVDLESFIDSRMLPNVDLRQANLEFANVPSSIELPKDSSFIPPGGSSDFEFVQEYCQRHGLLGPAKYKMPDPPSKYQYAGVNSDEFVLIPGGSHRISDSKHECTEVMVPSFLIDRHPVTNGQFLAFTKDFPIWGKKEGSKRTANNWYLRHWPDDSDHSLFADDEWLTRPVTLITWYAARAYAAASGLRLPTEVEWEIACRLGQKSGLTKRPWGDDFAYKGKPTAIHAQFTVRETSFAPTHSVYEIKEGFVQWMSSLSPIDVPCQMVGLVKEYVLDSWSGTYPPMNRGSTELGPPINLGLHEGKWGPAEDLVDVVVLRGGSYLSSRSELRCDYRTQQPANNVNSDVGFRCVRPISVPRQNF